MSSIYIQEPPTLGKVLLHTTVGEIDVELWSREAPRACRNFVQLCLEGYYDRTIFHRLVKGFIVQGGDPTGTGEGGESAYGSSFKDEFHTRIRFNHRGLLAMANAGKDDNGSQFFFTLGPTPELQNKHTIFGKVTGETIYNMLKLAEGLVDRNERPEFPNKIISTEVLSNPFPDIVPRVKQLDAADEKAKKEKKDKRAAVKDFKLLSFGSEAEDDEAECEQASRLFAATRPSKSAHDLVSDSSLSSAPAVPVDELALSGDEDEFIGPAPPVDTTSIRNKLQKKEPSSNLRKHKATPAGNIIPSKKLKNDDLEFESTTPCKSHKHKADLLENDAHASKSVELNDAEAEDGSASPGREDSAEMLKRLREEYKQLRNQLRKERKRDRDDEALSDDTVDDDSKRKKHSTVVLNEFEAERDKYRHLKNQIPGRGVSRENFTLDLLKKFQQKLALAKESVNENEEGDDDLGQKSGEGKEEGEDDEDSGWMTHKLQFNKADAVLAKDANTKDDDWFDIYDPRNPVTKRRREVGQDKKAGRDSGRPRNRQ